MIYTALATDDILAGQSVIVYDIAPDTELKIRASDPKNLDDRPNATALGDANKGQYVKVDVFDGWIHIRILSASFNLPPIGTVNTDGNLVIRLGVNDE